MLQPPRPLLAFILSLALPLSACSDIDDEQPPDRAGATAAAQAAPPVPASQDCLVSASAQTRLDCLSQQQRYEESVCAQAKRTLSARGLLPPLEQDSQASPATLRDALQRVQSDEPAAAYILAQTAYIEIGQDAYARRPGAVFFGVQGLYCAPSGLRLKELESLGPSDAAWRVREQWLDGYLPLVHYPWVDEDVSEEFLFNEFERLKQFYQRPQDRAALRLWTAKAEQQFMEKLEAASYDDGQGLTRAKHEQTLQGWLQRLRAGL